MLTIIAFGSNISPEDNIKKGLRLLKEAVRIDALSDFYRTHPAGNRVQPDYINGQCRAETELSFDCLKEKLREIEKLCGRERDMKDKYSSRTLDLDILLFGEELTDPEELRERDFLKICLEEIAPEIRYPGKKDFHERLKKKFMDDKQIIRLPELSRELKGLIYG